MITLDPRILEHVAALTPARLGPCDREVIARAAHLPPRDRVLVELVYKYQVPVRRVAGLLGLEPGNVSRQARRLWGRLAHPIVSKLCGEPCPFDAQTRAIGIDFFLRKAPLKDIARAHGVPPRRVSEALGFVRGFQDAARRASQLV